MRLRSLYNDYCYNEATKVSVDSGAISLRAAESIWQTLESRLPTRVLDTGSGFTSVLLRLYKAWRAGEGHAVDVTSADHDAYWLGQTHRFLAGAELPTENLLVGLDGIRGPFDLVIHDYAHMAVRQETLPHVWSLVGDGGLLVVDDLHFPAYMAAARALFGDDLRVLIEKTTDQYGRFIGTVEKAAATAPAVDLLYFDESLGDAGEVEPPVLTGVLSVVLPLPVLNDAADGAEAEQAPEEQGGGGSIMPDGEGGPP